MSLTRVASALDQRSDDVLLARYVAARDETAFRTLLHRHSGAVLRTCRWRAGDTHAAEDAFQATFLALARYADRVQAGMLPRWLQRVAGRHGRKAGAFARGRTVSARADVPDVPAPGPDASVRAEWAEVRAAVAGLPARYAEVIRLCCLEQHTDAHAARLLGLTPGAVERRRRTAINRLRDVLARRGVALAAGLSALRAVAGGEVRASDRLVADTLAAVHGTGSAAVRAIARGTFDAAGVKFVAIGVMLAVGLAVCAIEAAQRPAARAEASQAPAARPAQVLEAVVAVRPDGVETLFESAVPLKLAAGGNGLVVTEGGNRIWRRVGRTWELVDDTPGDKKLICVGDTLVYTTAGTRLYRWAGGVRTLLAESDERMRFTVDDDGSVFVVKKRREVWQVGNPEVLDDSRVSKTVYAGGGNLFMVTHGTDGDRVWAWHGSKLFDRAILPDRWFEIDAGVESRELVADGNDLYMLKGGTQVWRWGDLKGRAARAGFHPGVPSTTVGEGGPCALGRPECLDDSRGTKLMDAGGGKLYVRGDHQEVRVWLRGSQSPEVIPARLRWKTIVGSEGTLHAVHRPR